MDHCQPLMKRLLIVVCSVVLSSFADAQVNIGVKGGIGINDQTGTTHSEKAFVGIQTSAIAKIPICKSISMQPLLGYYPKGKKRLDETLDDQSGNPVGSADIILRFDYIEFSAPFQFMFHDRDIQWLVGFGPFCSYAVGGRTVYKNVSGVPSQPKNAPMVFGENGENRWDAGVTVLVSAIFNTRWVVSANYDQGLTEVEPHGSKESTISGGLTIGYFFK
jgi:outer membrane protein with beta-barrel domain